MSMLSRFAATGTAPKLYSDDVFSTYLYTGNGAAQTISNGVNLADNGGIVWIKDRANTNSHAVFSASHGRLTTNSTAQQDGTSVMSQDTTGFSFTGSNTGSSNFLDSNQSARNYVSWTFRKAVKFFDVVTWTGDNTTRSISHSLGITPGMVVVKRTDAASTQGWVVWHSSIGGTNTVLLNSTAAAATLANGSISTATSTAFTVQAGSVNNADVNATGGTYVAYVFAHTTTSDGLIKCNNYTGNGSATGPSVTLGWEPQWVMVKRATGGVGDWKIFDSMRGLTVSGQNDAYIAANAVTAEASADWITPTATGFQITTTSTELNNNTDAYIYVAIRRQNKPQTSATNLFFNNVGAAASGGSNETAPARGFDLGIISSRAGGTSWEWIDRLRGLGLGTASTLTTAANSVSSDATAVAGSSTMIAATVNQGIASPTQAFARVVYGIKRAPGFFDIVCYTGTGANQSITHNLGAVPELIFIKNRASIQNWGVYYGVNTAGMNLNTTGIPTTSATFWNNTSPTSSVFTVGTSSSVNGSTNGMVAYLFATVAGVSKVGTYTGNGSSQTIDCGFTAGARFVLIKRTDSTGDWYVWDTARGIVAANDPHLSINTTAAEVTTDDSLDTDSTGFIVNQLAATNVNVNTATYLYLAIA